MNKFILILTIVAGASAGLIITYALKIPIAVAAIDTIQAKIATITIGGLNIGSIMSVASIIGLAGTAYGLISQYKSKVAAQVANAKQMVANDTTYKELVNVSNINTTLEGKLTEAANLKDTALQTLETKTQEFQGLTTKVTSLKDDLLNKDQKIDTLMDALRSIKLDKGEVIEKIVIK